MHRPLLCVLALALPLAGQPADRFLKADGRVLKTAHGTGETVALRGVNLGGWLELQSWMCPVDSSKAPALRDLNPGHNGYDFDVRRLLAERFGAEQAERLLAAYQDAWLTALDLDQIKALGLNAVRLTLAYDTLCNLDGTPRADAFRRVDWLVEQAWQRGLYTIIDYHAFLPPAADQDGSATGYFASEAQQAETVAIWTRLAEHFKGNPAVALYDLLNEPTNSVPKGKQAPRKEVVQALYDRLYRAIRRVDPDHAIAFEGFWGWDTLRDPREAGYTNVVVSLHWYYWWTKTTADRRKALDGDLKQFTDKYRAWNVPLFVGEFNLFGDGAAWRYAVEQMDQAGVSWTLWTYKNTASGTNSWGVYTTLPGKAPAVPKLATDSADEIARKWAAWATDRGAFQLNPLFKPLLGAR